MICKVCGRNIQNEEANFCEYCGSSFRTNIASEQQYSNSGINNQNQEVYHDNKTIVNTAEKPISVGHWLVCMFLPFIPVVGFVVYPALLIYWSFSKKTTKTKKNWARASLLMFIILYIMILYYWPAIMSQMKSLGYPSL